MEKISRDYFLNGKKITITVPVYESNNSMVIKGKFRKKLFEGEHERISSVFSVGEPFVVAETTEFFSDLKKQVDFLQGKPLNKQTLFDALCDSCAEHIKRYGRLIDQDLDAYLDCSMFIAEAASIAFDWTHIDETLGNQLREEFANLAVKGFYDHIWVNRKSGNLPFLNFELIKLSDLNH